MLDINRSMLPYSMLWINGFYSLIFSQFLTSKRYLRDTNTMRDIPRAGNLPYTYHSPIMVRPKVGLLP